MMHLLEHFGVETARKLQKLLDYTSYATLEHLDEASVPSVYCTVYQWWLHGDVNIA